MSDQQQTLECYSNTSDSKSLGLMADIALSALSADFTPPNLDETKVLNVGGRAELSQEMAILSLLCKNGDDSISIALSASGDNAPTQKNDTTPKFNG